MVRVRKMSVSETAANLMRSDRWVHTWLERFDAGGLDGLRDLPRSGRPPKIPREIMARIIEQAVQPQCTPRELQKIIREDTGTRVTLIENFASHATVQGFVDVEPDRTSPEIL